MKYGKISKILLFTGLGIVVAGIIAGALLGFVFASEHEVLNLVVSLPVWFFCVFVGCMIMSVSGNFNEIQEKKNDDQQLLVDIINKIKNEQTSTQSADSTPSPQENDSNTK